MIFRRFNKELKLVLRSLSFTYYRPNVFCTQYLHTNLLFTESNYTQTENRKTALSLSFQFTLLVQNKNLLSKG
jgi:hypothetical protein